jgi:NhaP-type Na+/H+ or K+/H+ antiporter
MPIDIQSNCPNCKPQDAIVFPWFAELLGCCVLFVLTRYQIPVPFAAMMFIVGACIGAGSVLIDQDNVLQRSISIWTSIDSQLLLLVFLPPLIFKDAVLIPVHLFLVSTIQIWILAFPMVLLGTGLTGIVLYYIFPYDLNMWACLTLGAILASTDPIAVSSVLKTAGASPRLVMHISGESLLNDGSSFVFFTIFSRLLYISMGIQDDPEDKEVTVFEGFVLFFRMSLGGTAVGAAFGGALLLVLWELDRRLEREFDVLQVVAGLSTAYLCFYVCDQLLNMSGVVAVVVCGVIVNYFGRGLINDEELMESFPVLVSYVVLRVQGGAYIFIHPTEISQLYFFSSCRPNICSTLYYLL